MTFAIHRTAAKGFQNAPEAYERGRPEYLPEAVQRFIEELKIGPESAVVELGVGTGKFTKAFISASTAKLIAVEPVEGMRRKFAALLPSVEIVAGSAETIPMADGSADAVIAAQSFHWFNGPVALQEIHRVLKPRGQLGLIWNVRDYSVDWVAKLDEIYEVHEKGVPRYKTGAWKKAFDETTLFAPPQSASFTNVHSGGPETVVDRVASTSFISALPESEQLVVLEQVRELLRMHPLTRGKEKIDFPYRTDLFWCERRGGR